MGHTPQQPVQGLGDHGDHPAAEAEFEYGGITDELDRVAEPLLGYRQDRPPVQRCPIPSRGGQAIPGGSVQRQSPCVLRPSSLEIPRGQEQDAHQDVRLSVGGISLQRLPAIGQGLLRPAQSQQNHCPVPEGERIIRLQLQRLVERDQGRLGPHQFQQHVADVVESFGKIRPEAEGGPVGPARFLQSALFPQARTQAVPGPGAFRIPLQNRPAKPLRLDHPA